MLPKLASSIMSPERLIGPAEGYDAFANGSIWVGHQTNSTAAQVILRRDHQFKAWVL